MYAGEREKERANRIGGICHALTMRGYGIVWSLRCNIHVEASVGRASRGEQR